MLEVLFWKTTWNSLDEMLKKLSEPQYKYILAPKASAITNAGYRKLLDVKSMLRCQSEVGHSNPSFIKKEKASHQFQNKQSSRVASITFLCSAAD